MNKHRDGHQSWASCCGFSVELDVSILNESICVCGSGLSLSSRRSLSREEETDWMMWRTLWGMRWWVSTCSWLKKKKKILKEPRIPHSCSIPACVCHPRCVPECLVNGLVLANLCQVLLHSTRSSGRLVLLLTHEPRGRQRTQTVEGDVFFTPAKSGPR